MVGPSGCMMGHNLDDSIHVVLSSSDSSEVIIIAVITVINIVIVILVTIITIRFWCVVRAGGHFLAQNTFLKDFQASLYQNRVPCKLE